MQGYLEIVNGPDGQRLGKNKISSVKVDLNIDQNYRASADDGVKMHYLYHIQMRTFNDTFVFTGVTPIDHMHRTFFAQEWRFTPMR